MPAIRQDNSISGVTVTNSGLSIKILQDAEDATLFERNETDLREVLAKLKTFAYFPFLQLNESKSNAMILSRIYPNLK